MQVPATWFAAAVAVAVLLLSGWVLSVRSLARRLKDARHRNVSQSTRYGQITEQFAPFLASWPWDPKRFRFLGSPVDGVQFTDDAVVFVEVKSATSRLSPEQQRVRALVEAGKVRWAEVRIG